MTLYLIHDLQKKTYSHPLVGPDLTTIQQSLNELNPENLSDLKVIVLDTLETLDDLIKLRVNKNINAKTILRNLQPKKSSVVKKSKIIKA